MLSTLRGPVRVVARRLLPSSVGSLESKAISPAASSAPALRYFCSEPEKKTPKGFEGFYRTTEKAAPKEGSKGPSETAKKEAAENTSTAADGPSTGPKETPTETGGKKDGKPSEKSDNGAERSTKKTSSSKKENQDDGGSPNQMQNNAAMLVGALALAAYLYWSPADPGQEITIQELLKEHVVKGHVDRIQIVNKSLCRVMLRKDAPGELAGRVLHIQLGTPEAFESKLEQLQLELGLTVFDHVPIQYVNEMDFLQDVFLPYLPSLLFMVPFIFMARAMSQGMGGAGGMGGGGAGGRNMFSMGKAFPEGHKGVKSKVKFKDVAGLDQAKREVVEFVDFLKDPSKYEKLGAKIPKGGLLVGPPGTGKTLLAKAVAGEADVPFYSMSGSDFIEMFVGVGPSRVRDLFKQARDTAPSIVFIDEIDAVGRKRGKGGFSGGGNDERENTLNQMLVEMDGFSSGTGVVVLAGTNRADVLDPALTRPGRFDRTIAIDKPDLREREAIFKVHLKPLTLDVQLSMESVAKRMAALTPGFAGADIANIANEAAIFAARRDALAVEMVDFERATERVMGGLVKENSLMSPEEKRVVALHESGHAVAGWFLKHADPLLKVSIVPRSNGALGFAQYLPEEIRLYSQESILDRICVTLGGRAAEELFVGKISTGASDDLDKVTKMAYSMVSVYGMNPEIGLLSYNQNDSSQQFYKPYSEETARIIDHEARQIVEQCYERVKDLLREKTDLMHALSDKLELQETIVYNDLVATLGERPFAMKEEYRQFVTAGGNPFTDISTDSKEPAEAAAKDAAESTPAEPAAADAGSSEKAAEAKAPEAKA